MDSLSHLPDTPQGAKLSSEHAGLIEDSPPAERTLPPDALEMLAWLQSREGVDREIRPGASYAERHTAETGHSFGKGCCARRENCCTGCRKILPRIAKIKGETYCSRSCREAHTPS